MTGKSADNHRVTPLAELMLQHRSERGLTQTAMASLVGISESMIAHVETGRRNLGGDSVQRIVEALRLDDEAAAELWAARRDTSVILSTPSAPPSSDRWQPPSSKSSSDDDLLRRLEELEARLSEVDGRSSSPLEGLSRGERKKRWKEVGRQVSARMKELGYSIGNISAFTMLTEPFVARITKGSPRGEPDPENLRKIAAELGWSQDSIERILEGDDPVILEPGDPEYEERAEMLRARFRSIMPANHELRARVEERLARERAEAQARLDDSL